MAQSKDAEFIDEVANGAHWVHTIGDVLAEGWCADGGSMTEGQAVAARLFRCEIQQHGSSKPVIRYWLPSGGADPLEQIDAAGWQSAVELLDELTSNAAIAHICDVLWVGSALPKRHLFAHRAVAAYVERVGEVDLTFAERLRCARRSVDISKRLNDQALVEAVILSIEDAIRSVSPLPADGLMLLVRSLELLVSAGGYTDLVHQCVLDLCDSADVGPHVLQDAAELMAASPDAECRERVLAAAIDRFVEVAEMAEGGTAYSFMRQAVQLAARYGHRREPELRAALQAIDAFAGVDPIRTELKISHADVMPEIRTIVDADNIVDALLRLMPLFLGSVEALDSDEVEVSGLMAHISQVRMGVHGSTIRVAGTDCAALDASRSLRREKVAMLCHVVLAPCVDRLATSYVECVDILGSYLRARGTKEPVVYAAIEGVRLVAERRYEAAASILLPRVEQQVRDVAAANGVVVTGDPRGHKRGGADGLGTVLSALRERFTATHSQAFIAALQNILTDDQRGFNLRNEQLHGLNDRPTDSWEAALALCCMFLAAHLDQALEVADSLLQQITATG